MKKNVTTIPDAMISGVEFFLLNGEIQFIENGTHRLFSEMDIQLASSIRKLMDEDAQVTEGLELLGITDPIEQLKQFIFCQFGEFDKTADIAPDGKINTEYWDCGNRPCPADGLLCKLPSITEGHLTRNEVNLIREVSFDQSDKLIANKLGRSRYTVGTELKTIRRKLRCYTRAGIASFAGRHNIL